MKIGSSQALGLLLWALLTSLGVSAAERDEQRLQAIRKAMVDAATNAPTQVSSTSWMDSNGALREFNRFTSEIRLRDLREAPVRDVRAQDAVVLASPAEPLPPKACPAPAARTALRHVMAVGLALSPELTAPQRYPAQMVGRVAMAGLTALAPTAKHWRVMHEPQPSRAYERQLQGQGQEHVQWQVLLQVEPLVGTASAQDLPALVLHWQVRVRGQQLWFQWRDDIPPPREVVNASTPRIDTAMAEAIGRSVRRFANELDQRLACEPQTVQLQLDDGKLVLSAGDLAGLRVGDRVLLADARTLPQHVLEPGALDAAVLAEVKSVSVYRAELKQVAGPKQKINPSWVAWPYTY